MLKIGLPALDDEEEATPLLLLEEEGLLEPGLAAAECRLISLSDTARGIVFD